MDENTLRPFSLNITLKKISPPKKTTLINQKTLELAANSICLEISSFKNQVQLKITNTMTLEGNGKHLQR